MPDDLKPERGAEQPSEGLPIPKLETPSPVSSPSSVDIEAIVKQVADKLQRDLRMAQSTKDKEIAAIKKKLEISDLSELEEMGVPIPDNVKLEYRLRQIEGHRQPDNSPVQKTSSPGNGEALTAQDVSEVVKSFNLDANNADVIEALRGTYRNRDHFEASLARLAMKPKIQSTPAESPSLQSSPPAGKMGESEADQKYAELGKLLRNPSANAAKITNLTKELQDSGYAV